MDEKTLRIIPFTGEKEKWRMWSGKFIEIYGIKGYHFLLRDDKKIMADTKEKTYEKLFYAHKLLNKTTHN